MTNSEKKKALFLLPALTAGGAERVMINLMNGMDTSKFEPSFLTVSNKGELKDLISASIPFESLNLDGVMFSLPKLYKTIKKHNPDIVISTMAHMNFAVLLLKPFFKQTKFIVREAITPSFLLEKYKKSAFVIKALYRTLYSRADIVLSPSQIIFDEFRDILRMTSNNFRVLPNPVMTKDIDVIDYTSPISQRRKKTIQFIAAGRLGKQKGFDRLIEYLPQLKLKYDWTLTILGEGNERSHLETLIQKHGFEDKVFLAGLVRPPWLHYIKADCFLMPSRYEGLPNVVLESLACGTPAIVTKESGGIQFIADNAPKGSVTIVNDMNGFIKEMEKVKPAPSIKRKKSLLDDIFTPDSVFSEFESILLNI